MSSPLDNKRCDQSPQVSAYVMRALSPSEAAAVEAHIASCAQCQQELETLRPVVDSFVFWPADAGTSEVERFAGDIVPLVRERLR